MIKTLLKIAFVLINLLLNLNLAAQQDTFYTTIDLRMHPSQSDFLKIINPQGIDENAFFLSNLTKEFQKKKSVIFYDENFNYKDTLYCGTTSKGKTPELIHFTNLKFLRLKLKMYWQDSLLHSIPVALAPVVEKDSIQQIPFWVKTKSIQNPNLYSEEIIWAKELPSTQKSISSIKSSTPETSFWKYIFKAWQENIITLSDPLGPYCGKEMRNMLLKKVENTNEDQFKVLFRISVFLEERKNKTQILVKLNKFALILDQEYERNLESVIWYDEYWRSSCPE